MHPRDLMQRLQKSAPPTIVDVRSGFEFRSGHIPGALHAPLWRLLLRLVTLPADRQTLLVVACEHGPRAELAASLLRRRGYREVQLLDGHMAQWRRANLPLER